MPSVFAIVLECLGLKLISVTLAVFLARQQLFFVVALQLCKPHPFFLSRGTK